MTESRSAGSAWAGTLASREGWLRILCYALFIFSTFSIVGMDLALILLALFAGWHRWRTPVQEPLPRWAYAPFIGYLVAISISAAVYDPSPVWLLERVARQGEYFRFLLPFALLPALGFVSWKRLLRVYLVVVALFTVYAVIQYFFGVDWLRVSGRNLAAEFEDTGRYHAKGAFSHHLTFAGVWLMTVPIFLSLAWSYRGRERWLWGFGAFMGALGTLVSMGRSGWLGAFVGVLVLVLRLPRRWAVSIICLGLALTVAVVAVLTHDPLRRSLERHAPSVLAQRLLVTSPLHDVERFVLWDMAWLGFEDHPLFGAGGGDQAAFDPYRVEAARRWDWDFEGRTPKAHNMYLQQAFHFGLLGLAAFFWLWITFFVWNTRWIRRAGNAFPLEKGLLWGIMGAFAGLLTQAVFQNNFTDAEVQVNLLMWMGVALAAGLRIRKGLSGADAGAP